ncbi:hypothetical protein ACFRCX_36715 [Streptomyces sp. NPDC056652]|uniref:hypothetical protein n=1 Tax=Streptomyces sp. NPDC056652 TaxID=3345893 RepID=UPI0036B3FD06
MREDGIIQTHAGVPKADYSGRFPASTAQVHIRGHDVYIDRPCKFCLSETCTAGTVERSHLPGVAIELRASEVEPGCHCSRERDWTTEDRFPKRRFLNNSTFVKQHFSCEICAVELRPIPEDYFAEKYPRGEYCGTEVRHSNELSAGEVGIFESCLIEIN